jgi:hypothetical protein
MGAAMSPTYNSNCADCGFDTINEVPEWYMVKDEIWLQAWGHTERSALGQQILHRRRLPT